MYDNQVSFRVVPIPAVDCLKGAKRLIGEEFWLFVAICVVGCLVGSALPLGILMGPMFCGIHLCFRQRERGERVRFETLFKGFVFFAEGMVASLIITLGTMIMLGLPMVILFMSLFGFGFAGGAGNPNVAVGATFAMMAIVGVLLFVAFVVTEAMTMFVFPLIVDHGLSASDALKISARAAKANLGGVVSLTLLSWSLAIVAYLCCIFPLILFLPIQLGAKHLAYNLVFSPSGDLEFVSPFEPDSPAESGWFDDEPTTLRERDYLD